MFHTYMYAFQRSLFNFLFGDKMGTSASKKKGNVNSDNTDNTQPVCNDDRTAVEISPSSTTIIGIRVGGDDVGSPNVLVDAHVENKPMNNSVEETYSDEDSEYYSASDGEGKLAYCCVSNYSI